MNKKRTIIIMLIVGIVAGLALLGFKIHSMRRENAKMTYEEASVRSKEIAEQKAKQDKYIEAVNKNKKLTREEEQKQKQEQELKDKTTSDLYKQYEKLSDEEKEKIDAIPREKEIPMDELDDIIDDQKEDNIIEVPAKFSLTEKIDIKVENQGGRGLCWDFASMKSLETFLSLHENKNYDFSEQHVNYITSNLLYNSNRKIDEGGNFSIFKDYLAQSGVVLENDVPYEKNYGEAEYSKFIDMDPVKVVTNTVEFPGIYKNSYDYNMSNEDLSKFRDTVKKHIMTNGSLYAIISSSCINGNNCYASKNTTNKFADHAISIVGWDDSYPREKFRDGENVPEYDGAYIALNSWGENAHTNPDDDTRSGYFYISYDDMYVEANMSGISSVSFDKDSVVDLSEIKSPGIKNYLLKNFNYAIKEKDNKKYLPKMIFSDILSLRIENVDVNLKELEIFPSLSTLYINNANLTSIEDLPLYDNLWLIDLSNNNITNVDKLAEYKNLKMVYLSNNKIQDVSSLSNSGISDLDISSNVGVSGYSTINSLHNLLLDNNNISQVEGVPPEIVSLSINNNNFEELPTNITGLSNLYIKNNKIKNLNGVDNYLHLCTLDISGNNMESLVVENNNLSFIYNDSNINDVKILNDANVSHLELKNDNIKSLKEYIPGSNLYSINLSNNKGIKDYGKLPVKQLQLNGNDISELEDLYQDIEVLSVNENNLNNLDVFSKYNKLILLDINNNKSKLKGTLTNKTIRNLSFSGSEIDKDIKLDLNEELAIDVSGLDSYINVKKAYDKGIIFVKDLVLDESAFELFAVSENTYFVNPVYNIDVYKNDNVIEMDKISELDKNILYNITECLNEDGAVISRDRNKIILNDNLNKVSFAGTVVKYQTTYYSDIVLNIKEKESLLDSIFKLFK